MNHHVSRSVHVQSAAAALLALALTAGSATAQWSSDPMQNLAIVVAPGGQELPKVASAPDNATWISWFDNRTGGYQVRIQRLDAAGNPTFGPAGLLVSDHPQESFLVDYDLIADRDGNAVLVFTDTRSDPNRDVYAYLISPSGEFLWGEDGLTLSDNSAFEADPRVVQASNGEYVFLWPRLDNPAPGLYMQRVGPDGAKRFGEEGIVVAGNGTEQPAFCEMVASDDGSVIAVWVRDTRTFLSPRYLHAQKFDLDGNPLWSPDPVVVQPTSVPIAHRPSIVSDGGAGAIIAWHDARLSNIFNVWVQRLGDSGELLFPAGGVQVSANNTDRQHFDPALVFSPESSSIYVFWNERNGAQSQWGVSGQRISLAGARLWGPQGIPFIGVNSINKLAIRAAALPGRDAAVFYLEQPGAGPGHRVIGLRVDPLGQFVWPGSTIEVSSIVSPKGRLPIAIHPASGMVKLVWEDQRSGNNDIYAQNVNPDGTLGVAGGPACPAVYDDDGQVNSNDISAFLSAWLDSVQNGNLNADFDQSGSVNSNDISAFLSAWLDAVHTGC